MHGTPVGVPEVGVFLCVEKLCNVVIVFLFRLIAIPISVELIGNPDVGYEACDELLL